MSNNSNNGMGLITVLTLIFIVLKLVGIITWSWWLVLSPIILDIAIAGLVVAVISLKD